MYSDYINVPWLDHDLPIAIKQNVTILSSICTTNLIYNAR